MYIVPPLWTPLSWCTKMYHHLFTLSARSYTIPRNFCDAFSTPVAINLIRFRDFGERLIGEDARGSSSKGLLVYPPLVLAATVCGYDRTRYVARTVQQLLLASTTRRRDGSRRNKREKAWRPRCRGREGLINAVSIFVVSTLNILHSFLRLHFVASCLLVQSPHQVLQCSTYYLRAAKDPKTCKTLRLSTHPFS